MRGTINGHPGQSGAPQRVIRGAIRGSSEGHQRVIRGPSEGHQRPSEGDQFEGFHLDRGKRVIRGTRRCNQKALRTMVAVENTHHCPVLSTIAVQCCAACSARCSVARLWGNGLMSSLP